jgi:hypothetical protein
MKSPAKSFKWIFFRVINYLHIVAGFFVIVVAIIGNWPLRFTDISLFLGFFLALLVFCVFIANGLSNLYLLERHYPDQLPSRVASRFNLVMYILLIIVSSVMIIIFFGGLFSRYNSDDAEDAFPFVALVFFGSFGAASIPVWFLQIQLRRILKRNYYTAFDEFLETENP